MQFTQHQFALSDFGVSWLVDWTDGCRMLPLLRRSVSCWLWAEMGTTAHFDPGAQPHDHSCAAGCCSLLEEFTGLGMVEVICGSLKLSCEIAICAWSLQALNLLKLVSAVLSTIGTELFLVASMPYKHKVQRWSIGHQKKLRCVHGRMAVFSWAWQGQRTASQQIGFSRLFLWGLYAKIKESLAFLFTAALKAWWNCHGAFQALSQSSLSALWADYGVEGMPFSSIVSQPRI